MNRLAAALAVAAALWAAGGPIYGAGAESPSSERIDAVLAMRNLTAAARDQPRAELLRLAKAEDELLANPGKQGDLREAVLDHLGIKDPAERTRLTKVMDDYDKDSIRVLLQLAVHRVTKTGVRFDERQGTEVILLHRVSGLTVELDGSVELGRPGTSGREMWVPKGSCQVGDLVTFHKQSGDSPAVEHVAQGYYDSIGPWAQGRVEALKELGVHRVSETHIKIDEQGSAEDIRIIRLRSPVGGGSGDPADAEAGGKEQWVPIGTCETGEFVTILIEPPMILVVKIPKDYFSWVGKDGTLYGPRTNEPGASGQPANFDNAQPQPRLLLKGSVSQDVEAGNTNGFLRDLANHEGRKEWPYLDTNGNVTTAVGHLVKGAEAFAGLGWVNKATGAPAAPQEIKQGWDTLQTLKGQGKFGNHFTAEWFKNKTGLALPDPTVNDIYVKDVRSHADGVRKSMGAAKFDAAPQAAQEAIIDMAYQLGPGFLTNGVWPKFSAAVDRGDWKAAADECRRPEANADRNTWTRNKLLSAVGN
jgi:GH24 family phage-related lysozyme (muramidase)